MEPIYDQVRARIEDLQRTAATVRLQRESSATTPTTTAAADPQRTTRLDPDLRSGPCPQPTSTAAAR